MRFFCTGLSVVFLGTAFAASVSAQKTRPRKAQPAKPPVSRTVVPLDVRTAREKVEIQRSNTSRFIDVLGPIAQEIENTSEAAKRQNLPRATVDRNEQNKKRVIAAIRNLRVGIANLESEFRTRSSLRRYLSTIQGATDHVASSEDLALAGRFVAAKDPLRDVLKKLTDTLNVLPK
ncbi:MAG TPA: hypothetical protein PKC65_15165 [Pyrinomonadaceae bacterium]|nr:hypothetical protein [Pyrinomonadaceae bacterium]